MVLMCDSLAVVFLGDWNKLYIQPNWVAENIFDGNEIELRINGEGTDFLVSYQRNGIIIFPGQDKMVFRAENINDDTITELCSCINKFIKTAYTPQLNAYGFNIDFEEEDGTPFAEVLDSMKDTCDIIDIGYEVASSQIIRTLKKNNNIINMDSQLKAGKLKVHFNEHHLSGTEKPDFAPKCIKDFIKECCNIMEGLGYEMEDDE